MCAGVDRPLFSMADFGAAVHAVWGMARLLCVLSPAFSPAAAGPLNIVQRPCCRAMPSLCPSCPAARPPQVLNPDVHKGPWTPEEDEAIMRCDLIGIFLLKCKRTRSV